MLRTLTRVAAAALLALAPQTARADPANDCHSSGGDCTTVVDEDWVEYHNAGPVFHESQVATLSGTHRLISLDVAGAGDHPRYSAVWILGAASQHFTPALDGGTPCCSKTELLTAIADEAANGYEPWLVSATDVGTEARFAAVFEPGDGAVVAFRDKAGFIAKNKTERAAGRILRWATAYGPSTAPTYIGLWDALEVPGVPDALPRWASSAGISTTDYKSELRAYDHAWVRPGVLALAPDGTVTAAWYDSLLPDGIPDLPHVTQRDLAMVNVDDVALDTAITTFAADGIMPMQVQAQVQNGVLHYSAIFASYDALSPDPERRVLGMTRVFASEGSPDLAVDDTLQSFEDGLQEFMRVHQVRDASLAVVWQGRLLFARGYTWAEEDSDYPSPDPTRRFRWGSVSKVITMLMACVAEQDGQLSLDDKVIDDLVPAVTAGDPEFDDITFRHAIAHTSGLPRNPDTDETIAQALNAGELPISRAMQSEYEVQNVPVDCDKPTEPCSPGDQFTYSNLAYFFLGRGASHALGLSYTDAVESTVFAALFPAGHDPTPGASTFAGQGADEARYHTESLRIAPTVMRTAQPLQPEQYGVTNLSLHLAEGGWTATAPQIAKIASLFALPVGIPNPVLDPAHLRDPATGHGMLDPLRRDDGSIISGRTMGGFVTTLDTAVDADGNSCDIPTGQQVKVFEKTGSIGGIRSTLMARSDGLAIAAVVTGATGLTSCELNQWAPPPATLDTIPASTDYFSTYDVLPF